MAFVTTSWDDGGTSDLALGRLLAGRGLRATFYATTGPGGHRAIGDGDLAGLVDLGHELGIHGRTHALFTELSSAALRSEIEWARAETARFGPEAIVAAPPLGRINAEVVRTLHAEGLAVRAAPILGGRAVAGDLIPTAQVYPHSRARTLSHLARRRILPSPAALAAWSTHDDLWKRLRALARGAHAHGRDLHLWGHSEEIERLDLWDRLDSLLGDLISLGFVPATNGEVVRGPG